MQYKWLKDSVRQSKVYCTKLHRVHKSLYPSTYAKILEYSTANMNRLLTSLTPFPVPAFRFNLNTGRFLVFKLVAWQLNGHVWYGEWCYTWLYWFIILLISRYICGGGDGCSGRYNQVMSHSPTPHKWSLALTIHCRISVYTCEALVSGQFICRSQL